MSYKPFQRLYETIRILLGDGRPLRYVFALNPEGPDAVFFKEAGQETAWFSNIFERYKREAGRMPKNVSTPSEPKARQLELNLEGRL